MPNKIIGVIDGKEIKEKNLVCIDGNNYDKSVESPPQVIYLEDYSWVIYNPKHYIQESITKVWYKKSHCYTIITGYNEIKKKFEHVHVRDIIPYVKKKLNYTYQYLDYDSLPKLEVNTFGTKSAYAVSSKILIKAGFAENPFTGNFLKKNSVKYKAYLKEAKRFVAPNKKTGKYSDDPQGKEQRRHRDLELGIKSISHRISEGKKYTFGVEIETCSGFLRRNVYEENRLNLECTHDGSIEGGEYVTGILTGDAGFRNLYKSVKEVASRCKIDKTCGIHVHIGGAIFNKEFNVLAYILGRKLQDDVFSMLPPSRSKNIYCGNLPSLGLEKIIDEYGYEYGIDLAYEKLFKALSNGRELSQKFNKDKLHPDGRYCGQYNGIDLDKILRYKWLNLVTCNFNTRGARIPNQKERSKADRNRPLTIEFRNHSASLNYAKIKNWVLICMAYVDFIQNNKEDILNNDKITIEDLIVSAYNKNADSMLKYVQERKSRFSTKLSIEEESKIEYENDRDVSYHENVKIKDLCV